MSIAGARSTSVAQAAGERFGRNHGRWKRERIRSISHIQNTHVGRFDQSDVAGMNGIRIYVGQARRKLARDYIRRTASKLKTLFHICRMGVNSVKVFRLQRRIVLKDLLLRHPACQPLQDVCYCDPQTPDARLSRPLPRLNRDPVACSSFGRVVRLADRKTAPNHHRAGVKHPNHDVFHSLAEGLQNL